MNVGGDGEEEGLDATNEEEEGLEEDGADAAGSTGVTNEKREADNGTLPAGEGLVTEEEEGSEEGAAAEVKDGELGLGAAAVWGLGAGRADVVLEEERGRREEKEVGRSPAEGDGALTSSTGLVWRKINNVKINYCLLQKQSLKIKAVKQDEKKDKQ